MNDEEKQKLMASFLGDDEKRRLAIDKANEKWRKKRDAELAASNLPVEGGSTKLDAPSLSPLAQERQLQREGQAGVGRTPEEVVIGGKRTDWDPNKKN